MSPASGPLARSGTGAGLPNGCPELRELRYFVAVAEELHFTRAAQRLHIAQQALSTAIRQLEARLGVSLFERTSRQVHLTGAGQALFPKAQLALAAAAEAAAAARDAGRGVTGRLVVGVSRSATAFGFAALRAMQEQAPGVQVSARHDFAHPLVEELTAGQLDAAFVFCPEYRSCLDYQRLADEQAVAVMHPAHRLADRAELRVSDLKEEILVLAGPGIADGYNTAVLTLCQRAGVTPRTARSAGFLGPVGVGPHETLGVLTQTALDGAHTDFQLIAIPIHGATLPFDLAWQRGRGSPAVGTLRSVTAGTALAAGWPRNAH